MTDNGWVRRHRLEELGRDNEQLRRELSELKVRVEYAQQVCELWVCDLIPARVGRILAGEERERHLGEGVADHEAAWPYVGSGSA